MYNISKQAQGVFLWLDSRKGVVAMTQYEALSIIIALCALVVEIVAIILAKKKKKKK